MNRTFQTTAKRITAAITSITTLAMLLATVPANALPITYTPSESYMEGPYYESLTNVTLTGYQRTDIVNVAISQLGYHESDSPNDLSGTSTNGTSNYTEYGRWYNWQGAWCGLFISWCAEQAQIPKTIIKKQGWASGCNPNSTSGNYGGVFMAYGTYTPQPGDIAYFDNGGDGGSDHVELVISVTEDTITTLGGNTNGGSGVMVGTHNIPVSTGNTGWSQIIGFEVPYYSGEAVPVVATDEELDIPFPRPTRKLSKGCKGIDVSWMQTALNRACGTDLTVDGVYGSGTVDAVKNFQELCGLEADGVAGSQTVEELVKLILNPVQFLFQVTATDASADTVFSWTETEKARCYELLIWQNACDDGDPYYTEYDLKTNSLAIALPAGTYGAYAQAVTEDGKLSSEHLTFTVAEAEEPTEEPTEAPTEEETEETTESETDAPTEPATDAPETEAPASLIPDLDVIFEESNTRFSWNAVDEATGYALYVSRNGISYMIASSRSTSKTICLPDGKYDVYLEVTTESGILRSDSVQFSLGSSLALGDVDGNGVVNSLDAAAILTAAADAGVNSASEYALTDAQRKAADLNFDGVFNVIDASIILDYAVYAATTGFDISVEEYLLSQGVL